MLPPRLNTLNTSLIGCFLFAGCVPPVTSDPHVVYSEAGPSTTQDGTTTDSSDNESSSTQGDGSTEDSDTDTTGDGDSATDTTGDDASTESDTSSTGDGDGTTTGGDGDGDGETTTTSTTGDGDGDGDSIGTTTTGDGDGDGDGGTGSFELLGNDLLTQTEGLLYRISVIDGSATFICSLNIPAGEPTAWSGLTFNRDDKLFGARHGTLYLIDLPSCDVTVVGDMAAGIIEEVNGLTPDDTDGPGLFAVDSNTDTLYRIDETTAAATFVGLIGIDIMAAGATWDDANQRLIILDSGSETLIELDPSTGAGATIATLSLAFGGVGFEYHPLTEKLFASTTTSGKPLYEVALNGQLTLIGNPDVGGATLAAPWGATIPIGN